MPDIKPENYPCLRSSGAKNANTEASGNVQKIYTAVGLVSFSRTEAIAQDNVKTSSIHGDRTMTGTAPTGNGGILMPDIDNVIKALKICAGEEDCVRNQCPYSGSKPGFCITNLERDALALLIEERNRNGSNERVAQVL